MLVNKAGTEDFICSKLKSFNWSLSPVPNVPIG